MENVKSKDQPNSSQALGWVPTQTSCEAAKQRAVPVLWVHAPEWFFITTLGAARCNYTGLPIFPLKTSPPPRDTHLSWAKNVMFKTAKKGNIGTPVTGLPD